MVPHSDIFFSLSVLFLGGISSLLVGGIRADGPLILTPLIEAGAIDEARTLARVGPLPGDDGVVSYAGFLTVNKAYNSNLYFWFFPSEMNYETAPVILWLEGGPGGSTILSLLLQNGPFVVDSNLTLSRREHSWTTNHSVLYIDNPVGTGFSFTDDENGYSTTQSEIGSNLYAALIQFFTLFPELQTNEFFTFGESYAGKYVPAIAYAIHINNPSADLKINLKGLGIAAGFSDPENMLDYGDHLYQIGLIDDNGRQQFRELENLCLQYVQQENWLEAYHVYLTLISGNSLFKNLTGYSIHINYLHTEDYVPIDNELFVMQEFVRETIHVGNMTIGGNESGAKLMEDTMKSVKPWLEELLEYYRVLFYNGQLDIIIAPPLTSNYLSKLQWSGREAYLNATRNQWYVGNDLAGYVKPAGNLIEAMVRNAGHGISFDQPGWALDLIRKAVGDPLLLTPLIDAGAIDEARNLARVGPLPGVDGVVSYAGYLTVNQTFNSNLFFWFFPAKVNATGAPVVLWLQGGPGAPSLIALFTENGPFVVNSDLTLSKRPVTWSSTHSMLYIDSPVGTGFSFTEDENGYATDQTQVAVNLYSALIQFFKLFPELQANDFFVTGESYGGKYVPSISYAIHTNNPSADLKINLKGLAIGNGWSDPVHMLNYGDYLYQIGLIDINGREQFRELQDLCIQYVNNNNFLEAFKVFDDIIAGTAGFGSLVYNLTGFSNNFNYQYNGPQLWGGYDLFVQQDNVREAIHVGNMVFNTGEEVLNKLTEDFMKSVKPWIEVLLENYRIAVYNGQFDIIVAYVLTENYLSTLEWSAAAEYKNATRNKWYVGDDLAGYVKTAGNLLDIMVRNAGHMVPTDQPIWALDLLTRFTSGVPFSK